MSEHNEPTQTDVAQAHGKHEHHIVSPKIYVIILLSLLVATAATVWASFLELGIWNPVIALAIACTKATLVVLFFMHVKYSTKLTMLTIAAGIFMFLTLIGMTLADYISRAWGQW
jgi:cytochrome c oxidase subunit 4